MARRWQRLLEHPIWNRPLYDIVMVMVWVVAALVAAFWAAEGSAFRLVTGLPLAVYLPGYTLVAALFANRPLDRAARALLSVACSLAITLLGGLVLNALPWGLQAETWALLLGFTCWLGGMAAIARRRQHPAEPAEPAGQAEAMLPNWLFGLRPGAMLLVGVSTLAVLGACWWSVGSALKAPAVGTSQVWLISVPDEHTGAVNRVQIGLRNLEGRTVTYRLQLAVDHEILSEWSAIILEDGEAADSYYPLPPVQAASEQVEALLYLADEPTAVYRQALIWRHRAEATPTLPLRPSAEATSRVTPTSSAALSSATPTPSAGG